MGARSPVLVVVLASLLLAGCGQADRPSDLGSDPPSKEAHFPAHWPGNFPTAIERLEVLLFDAQAELPMRISRWEEVNDLIGWLPELAADSDLNEPEWNRIDSAADELSRELKQLVPSPSAVWPDPNRLLEHLGPSWQTLRAGTEQYWEAFYRVNPGRRPVAGSDNP